MTNAEAAVLGLLVECPRHGYEIVVGYLKPRHPAGSQWVAIEAQQLVAGVWKPIKTYGTTTADNYSYSKYATSIVLPYTGSWRLRAVHADGNHARTVTGWSYTTVLPDPTIRFSGRGQFTSPSIRMSRGTHRLDVTWDAGDMGSFYVNYICWPVNGSPLDRQHGTFVPSQRGAGSGSVAMSFTTDVQLTLLVGGFMDPAWTLAIVP